MSKKYLTNPISYLGSKRLDMKYIMECAPLNFDLFVDVFGGGGCVSMYYQQQNIKVHYNDIDKDMCELFNILQDIDKTKKLLYDFNNMPVLTMDNVKEGLKSVQESYMEDKNIVKRLYLTSYCFRGLICHNTPKMRKDKNGEYYIDKTPSNYDKLLKYPEIFKNNYMEVSNLDFRNLLERYKNNENAFIYLDPPYLGSYCVPYIKNTYNKNDLNFLVSIIKDKSYKCKIMLHLNYIQNIEEDLKDYVKLIYSRKYNVTPSKKCNKIMIICNFVN